MSDKEITLLTYDELVDYLAEKVYEANKENYVDVELVGSEIVKTPQPKEVAIESAKSGVVLIADGVIRYVSDLIEVIEDMKKEIEDLEERVIILGGK